MAERRWLKNFSPVSGQTTFQPESGLTTYGGFAWVLPLIVLSACSAVGPDFARPATPAVTQYTEGRQPTATVSAPGPQGAAQAFQDNAEVPADWWTRFQSPALNSLVEAGLKNNPTLAAAEASLTNAQQTALAQRDNLMLPAVDAQASQTRQRLSTASFGMPGQVNTFNLTNVTVGVSYNFDLFGGNRRRVESFDAQVDAESYRFKAARAALAANIVTTAIREAALRDQIEAVESMVKAEGKTLELLKVRAQAGAVSQNDVMLQQTTVAQTEASLPGLQKQLAQTRHQLSVYVGRFPSEGGLPTFRLADLRLPTDLPVSVPSRLVGQRPDIKVSEALLHAATAQLGVAISDVLPNLSLTASYGQIGLRPGDLFTSSSPIWSLGGTLLQPIFHGGALKAGQRSAEAAVDQAAANYRATVLNAFQNVADVLRALETDAAALAAQETAARAAEVSLELARTQFSAGAVSYLTLLVAEDRFNQTRQSLALAQSARLADTAALYLAMGGG
jgi:NodT family efflux transporter outer membrane factor (OMF) lipoprotein